MKYLIRVLFLVVMTTNVYAVTPPTLDAIVKIPVQQLQAIESNGEILYMSKNGRFVIRGQLTDTWQKKSLDTIDEIQYATSHINVDVMGLPLDDMNTISVGNGPKQLIVFVDPQCPYCKTFIEEARPKMDEYTFKLVVVPALGKKSNQMAKSLFCASDKTNALEMLLEQKLGEMPQKETCNTESYDLTLVVAQMFGIRNVPFFIAPDGRFKPGTGKNFWNWVEQKG